MKERSRWAAARLGILSLAAAGLLAASCGGNDTPPRLQDPQGSGGRAGGERSDASAGSGGDSTDAATGTDAGQGGDAAAEAGPPPANCGQITCAGEGQQCELDDDGARCVCRFGYKPVGGPDAGSTGNLECEVDKDCVKLRFLEDNNCRVLLFAEPVIGLFFAVDYCAGTAVLPEELEEIANGGTLTEAFVVTEDGNVIDNSSESSISIVKRDVESYVGIVLDVSVSITDDQGLLEQVTSELIDFVNELKVDDPDVAISLTLFGRRPALAVPFTKDAAKVTDLLASIAKAPDETLDPIFAHPLTGEVLSRSGTVLLEAAERGVHEVQRILNLRRVVSDNGKLTSGTVVVITDGDDTNAGDRPQIPQVFNTTRVNLITIGISDQINGEILSAIGRDGEFLAPTAQSRQSAFTSVARRVKEHPDRAYMLAYCSSANKNMHTVEVGLSGKPEDGVTTASCTFDGANLGDLVCDAELFAQAPPDGRCGGIFANGACSEDECCAYDPVLGRDACMKPSPAADCRQAGFDFLCEPSSDVCIKTADDTFECEPPLPVGTECDERELRCQDGVTTCEESQAPDGGVGPDRCTPIEFVTGQNCQDEMGRPMKGKLCPERNCGRPREGLPHECLPEARMFQACAGSDADAICETGSYCQQVCKMRGPNGLFRCQRDEECASGICDLATHLCASSGECHFSWNDILE